MKSNGILFNGIKKETNKNKSISIQMTNREKHQLYLSIQHRKFDVSKPIKYEIDF